MITWLKNKKASLFTKVMLFRPSRKGYSKDHRISVSHPDNAGDRLLIFFEVPQALVSL